MAKNSYVELQISKQSQNKILTQTTSMTFYQTANTIIFTVRKVQKKSITI